LKVDEEPVPAPDSENDKVAKEKPVPLQAAGGFRLRDG
jgi:hypothetical protein